jgi:hypothetical protein
VFSVIVFDNHEQYTYNLLIIFLHRLGALLFKSPEMLRIVTKKNFLHETKAKCLSFYCYFQQSQRNQSVFPTLYTVRSRGEFLTTVGHEADPRTSKSCFFSYLTDDFRATSHSKQFCTSGAMVPHTLKV